MAIICTLHCPCTECAHYRWEEEEGQFACFLQADEEVKKKEKSHVESES